MGYIVSTVTQTTFMTRTEKQFVGVGVNTTFLSPVLRSCMIINSTVIERLLFAGTEGAKRLVMCVKYVVT